MPSENSGEQKILKVLSKKGVSDIIFCLAKEPKGFSQIMFDTRLNPNILNRHLKILIEMKIIEKKSRLYHLTEKGRTISEELKIIINLLIL